MATEKSLNGITRCHPPIESGNQTNGRPTRATSSAAASAAAAAAAAGAGVEAEAGASMAICKKARDIVIDDSSSRAVPACQRCKSFDPITLKEPTRNYRRASLGSSQSPSTAHSQAFVRKRSKSIKPQNLTSPKQPRPYALLVSRTPR
uniref:Uncharacterized protein n=1 Tax=Vespula pensylvanica TaxID=30213 RepID=A0A834U911_VESPE|nr:hypothetical protein H0235_008377 [Vespula pensylvanica]